MGIIICPSEFEQEDPNHKGYSMNEIDIYAWIPKSKGRNHRLTMWKNIKTGKYELVKIYKEQQIIAIGIPGEKPAGLFITNKDTNVPIEVVFDNENLEVVIEEINGMWNKYHGTDDYQREKDIICDHKHKKSFCCRI